MKKLTVCLDFVDNFYGAPQEFSANQIIEDNMAEEDIKALAKSVAEKLEYNNSYAIADYLGVADEEGFSIGVTEDCGPTFDYYVLDFTEYDSVSENYHTGFFLVTKDGKKGCINTSCKEVIPCNATQIYFPSGGVIIYKKDDKCGIYHIGEDILVDALYDEICYDGYETPVTAVYKGEQGFITDKGDFISKEDYECSDEFGVMIAVWNGWD